MLCIWLCVTCRPADEPRFMTNNRWRSVDAHFQDVVGHLLVFILITKAAKTSKLNCNLPMSKIYNYRYHIWIHPWLWNTKCRIRDWNRWVLQHPANPAGWPVGVWVWPIQSQRVGIVDGSGTKPTRCWGPNLNPLLTLVKNVLDRLHKYVKARIFKDHFNNWFTWVAQYPALQSICKPFGLLTTGTWQRTEIWDMIRSLALCCTTVFDSSKNNVNTVAETAYDEMVMWAVYRVS